MHNLHLKSIFFTSIIFSSIIPLSQFTQLNAEENQNSDGSDELLVVTANRIEQNINDTLASVDIIDRVDIERLQPESIIDLLSSVAGFDFVFTGGDGQSSSLFTRGSSSDHTLVLIDGIRVGSASLGNKDFSTIAVAQIERIEIIKGPRAALWGSDAIGGVIQIFTRTLDNNEVSFALTTGSDKFIRSSISTGFGNEQITNTVTLSYEASDGFDVFDDASEFGPDSEPDDDGYTRKSAALKGAYTPSTSSTLDWVIQFDSGENLFDNPFGANVNEYNNRLINLRYAFTNTQWRTEFSLKQSRDEAFSYDSRAAIKLGSTFITKRNQFNLLSQYSLSNEVQIVGGVEQYKDDVGGSDIQQFGGGSLPFDETVRNSKAVFVSSLIDSGKMLAELSIRKDDLDSAGKEDTFNLSVGYRINEHLILSASRAKGFKDPTFNDLYYPGFSNPELVSEVSFNNELMLKGHWKNQSFSVVKYDNQVDQLITFFFNPDTFAFAPINVDKANLKGHEITYQYRHGQLSHKLSASFVDAIDQSIDALTQIPKNEQLLRRAKEHYSYEVNADFDGVSFFGQVQYRGSRRDNDFSTFPAESVILDGYTVVNIGMSYELNKELSLGLRVSDLTNSEEPTVVHYNTAGRQVFLTFQYRNN